MPSTTIEDSCRTGFEIYRDPKRFRNSAHADGCEEIDADSPLTFINNTLACIGYEKKVSETTLKHYRALINAGYGHYISTKRFDLATSRRIQPIFAPRARHRFQEIGSDTDDKIVLKHEGISGTLELNGRAIRVSETGIVVELDSNQVGELDRQWNLSSGAGPTALFRDEATPVKGNVVAKYTEIVAGGSKNGASQQGDSRSCDEKKDTRKPIVHIDFGRWRPLGDMLPRFRNGNLGDTSTIEFGLDVRQNSDVEITSAQVLSKDFYYSVELLDAARVLYNEAHGWSPAEYLPPFAITDVRMDPHILHLRCNLVGIAQSSMQFSEMLVGWFEDQDWTKLGEQASSIGAAVAKLRELFGKRNRREQQPEEDRESTPPESTRADKDVGRAMEGIINSVGGQLIVYGDLNINVIDPRKI